MSAESVIVLVCALSSKTVVDRVLFKVIMFLAVDGVGSDADVTNTGMSDSSEEGCVEVGSKVRGIIGGVAGRGRVGRAGRWGGCVAIESSGKGGGEGSGEGKGKRGSGEESVVGSLYSGDVEGGEGGRSDGGGTVVVGEVSIGGAGDAGRGGGG
jgi:hypothetical protein